MKALGKRFVPLIEQSSAEAAVQAAALAPGLLDHEPRTDGVADDGEFEEAAALLDEYKAFQPIARARGAERGHGRKQQAVRERLAEARALRVLDVVMDRMRVPRQPGEKRTAHRPRSSTVRRMSQQVRA
jgi:hypothetical protein